jgi:hypothetical protein
VPGEQAKKIVGMESGMEYMLKMNKGDARLCMAVTEELATHRAGYEKVVQGVERDERKARDVLKEYLIPPKVSIYHADSVT